MAATNAAVAAVAALDFGPMGLAGRVVSPTNDSPQRASALTTATRRGAYVGGEGGRLPPFSEEEPGRRTVQQRRPTDAYDDEDGARGTHGHAGARSPNAHDSWPGGHVSLGAVLLAALVAIAVALGTSVTSLTVVRGGVGGTVADADFKALAARVKAVGDSVDAMARALSRDSGKGGAVAAAELSALRQEFTARLKEQEAALAKVKKQAGVSVETEATLRKEIAAAEKRFAESVRTGAGTVTKASGDRVTANEVDSLRKEISAISKRTAAVEKSDKASRRGGALSSAEKKDVERLKREVATLSTEVKTMVTRDTVEALRKEMTSLEKKAVSGKDIEGLNKDVAALVKFNPAAAAAKHKAEIEALRKELRAATGSKNELEALKKELTALAAKVKSASSNKGVATDAAAMEALRKEVSAMASKAAEHEAQLRSTMDSWKGRPLVTKKHIMEEIKLQMELFKADRTGLVDYALFSGGGKVVGHSALSPLVAKADGPLTNALKGLRGGVHPKADEWVISASQEAAGECLALNGGSGWVDLRLRQAVAVEAVTVEHIHRYIAYDITSAPKNIMVLGWNHTRAPAGAIRGGVGGAVVLGEFRYDILAAGGAMQTFNVTRGPAAEVSGGGVVVDHVRFEVKSNYGNEDWTCLYRLRVHGQPVASPSKPTFE